jgi:membrane-associated phospholipid phosphatase
VLYGAWLLAFGSVGRIAAHLPSADLTIPLDRLIPLVPLFIWPYILCYIFPFLPLVAMKDWHRFNRAFLAIILANVTAYLFYVTLPVAFPRPELGASLSDRILAWQYQVDFHPGANKLPSLHVAFIWIVAIACRKQRLGRFGDALVVLSAGVISLSTLFVKQHIILDVVTGAALGFAAWFAAKRIYPSLAGPPGEPVEACKRMIRKTAPAAVVYVLALILFAALKARRSI